MARKSRTQIELENKRKNIISYFRDKISQTPLDHAVFWDHVEKYMLYFDRLDKLSGMAEQCEDDPVIYIKINSECRQITKEMRNILTFLKLDPNTIPADEGDSLEL